jgi:hypothetical protein
MKVVPGNPTDCTLNSGEAVTVELDAPDDGSIVDFGVYERSGTIATGDLEIVGKDYKKAGVAREVHLLTAGRTVTIKPRTDCGMVHLVLKASLTQASAKKMASTQPKA